MVACPAKACSLTRIRSAHQGELTLTAFFTLDPFADADEDTGGDQQTNKGEYIHIRIQRTSKNLPFSDQLHSRPALFSDKPCSQSQLVHI